MIVLHRGDCVKVMPTLEPASVHLVVTSPPYALMRAAHYGGVHPTRYPVWWMSVMESIDHVLAPGGSVVIVWKAGRQGKRVQTWDLRAVLAMEDAGWAMRDEWIWHKPNPVPGRYGFAVTCGFERCLHVTRGTEDPAVWEPDRVARSRVGDFARGTTDHPSGLIRSSTVGHGRTTRIGTNVLTIPLHYNDQRHEHGAVRHPARFPNDLPRHFIRLLSDPDNVVLDPFAGSGTTLHVALEEARRAVGIEMKLEFCAEMERRFGARAGPQLHRNPERNPDPGLRPDACEPARVAA